MPQNIKDTQIKTDNDLTNVKMVITEYNSGDPASEKIKRFDPAKLVVSEASLYNMLKTMLTNGANLTITPNDTAKTLAFVATPAGNSNFLVSAVTKATPDVANDYIVFSAENVASDPNRKVTLREGGYLMIKDIIRVSGNVITLNTSDANNRVTFSIDESALNYTDIINGIVNSDALPTLLGKLDEHPRYTAEVTWDTTLSNVTGSNNKIAFVTGTLTSGTGRLRWAYPATLTTDQNVTLTEAQIKQLLIPGRTLRLDNSSVNQAAFLCDVVSLESNGDINVANIRSIGSGALGDGTMRVVLEGAFTRPAEIQPRYRGTWTANRVYVKGDYVDHQNNFYFCLNPNSDSTFTAANWKGATT